MSALGDGQDFLHCGTWCLLRDELRACTSAERRWTGPAPCTASAAGYAGPRGLRIAGCDAVLYGTGASRRPVAINRVGGKEERPQEW